MAQDCRLGTLRTTDGQCVNARSPQVVTIAARWNSSRAPEKRLNRMRSKNDMRLQVRKTHLHESILRRPVFRTPARARTRAQRTRARLCPRGFARRWRIPSDCEPDRGRHRPCLAGSVRSWIRPRTRPHRDALPHKDARVRILLHGHSRFSKVAASIAAESGTTQASPAMNMESTDGRSVFIAA